MKRSRREELKLVFSLIEVGDSKEISVGNLNTNFKSMAGAVDGIEVLRILVHTMRELGITDTFEENGKTISALATIKKIEKKGTWGHIESAELSFQYGIAGNYGHCFVSIQEKNASSAGDWERWVLPFLGKSGFIQAWIFDVEYDYWQNAKDLMEYENAGRDYAGLPLRSNGLPPPLEQLEIDTSCNPGRWHLRSGYVEAIGPVMWLGELFWNVVGESHRSRLRDNDWLKAIEMSHGILKIQVLNCQFSSGETAEIQDRLRALLYS